jgi:MFS family permease
MKPPHKTDFQSVDTELSTIGNESRSRRRAVIASTIGTVIEWYDFLLYAMAAGLIFPTLYFRNSDPIVAILNSFLVFAVGYIARPIGALVFGHYGDRLGRKGALVATVLLMGTGTFLVTFVPTYDQIGIWGAIMLCVLRFLQGVGVGGEWSGSILVAMEWAQAGKRGLFASWPQMGLPLGGLLANLALGGASLVTGAAFMTWGWRIPFALSLLLVAVGLYIRFGLEETPVFRKVLSEKRVEKLPVLQALRRTWRQILLTTLLRMSELASYVVYGVFVFAIGVQMLHFSHNFILAAVLVGLAIESIVVPLAGAISDRVGRKRMFMFGVVLYGIWGFVYFAGLSTGSPAIVALVIALSFIPHGIQYGPQGALIAENFPARLRYSGSSIGYQLASIVGGGLAPFIATALLARDRSGYLVAGYLLACSVISLTAATFMREGTHPDISHDQ